MANEWIKNALGDEHHIIIFLAVDTKNTGALDTAFKMGIHPGLRHVDPRTIDMIVGALEEGIDYMRRTPLDDLTFIGEMEST